MEADKTAAPTANPDPSQASEPLTGQAQPDAPAAQPAEPRQLPDPMSPPPIGDSNRIIKSPVPTNMIPAIAIGLLLVILLLAVVAYAFL